MERRRTAYRVERTHARLDETQRLVRLAQLPQIAAVRPQSQIAAQPVTITSGFPQGAAIGQEPDIAQRVVLLQGALVQPQHDDLNALSTQQAARIQAPNLAVVDQRIGAGQAKIEPLPSAIRPCPAERARVHAIIDPAVADEQDRWRVALHVLQLVVRPPQGEHRAELVDHPLAVQGGLDQPQQQQRQPERPPQARRQT